MPPQLFMRLSTLNDLPAMPRPAPGYAVRLLEPGEEPLLASLLSQAFGEENAWTDERVRRNLTEAADVEAVYVVANENGPVATASARYAPADYPDAGYLHWVGADDAHRGLGLGRLVVLRTLCHFRDTGRTCSVLETDDFRLPAIRTYLGLGYVPEMRDESHEERWRVVRANLEAARG